MYLNFIEIIALDYSPSALSILPNVILFIYRPEKTSDSQGGSPSGSDPKRIQDWIILPLFVSLSFQVRYFKTFTGRKLRYSIP